MQTTAGPVRVAVVSSVHRWNDTRVYLKQTRSLLRAGYDVILVAVAAEHQPFEAAGVPVFPLPRRRRLARWLNWISIVRIVLRHRAKIVHAHDPELFPIVAMLRLLGRRVVCDVHEDVAAQILNKEWIPAMLRRSLSAGARLFLRSLPTISNAVVLAEDAYTRNFPQRDNVVLIRNFPIVSDVHKNGYDTSVLRMIYVGDVRVVRGIETYIRIAHRLRARSVPVQLRVVGSFADGREEREMHALIGELGLEDCVQLLGRRRPEEVPDLVSQCDVGLALLHPIGNYRESYPTKMFEYMAAGLPVVASNFELWRAILEGSECGRAVDPLDVDEAAAALEEYWRAPDLRREHGENGRRAVMEKYRWEAELPRLLTLYSALAR